MIIPSKDLYFVIHAYDYSEICGGCAVLHLLVHKLNTLAGGEQPLAYLSNSYALNPRYATPVLPSWMNASQGVAVYPEVVSHNPLNAEHVVRWILYYPGINGGPKAHQYSPDDLIACYWAQYCHEFDVAKFQLAPLELVDYYWDFHLQLPKVEQRIGTIVFSAGKKNWAGHVREEPPPQLPGISSPTDMSRLVGKRERLEQFSRAEMFVSYDMATFRNVEAAMCGAISVVVPLPGVTAEQWRADSGIEFQYGIAYGLDDIPYARSTMHLVLPHLRAQAAKHDASLLKFVEAVQQYVARTRKG
jgi:hypothetical protein